MHFNWKTSWPHAVADIAQLGDTTEDPKAVTCAACLHALGSQQHDPPELDGNGLPPRAD